MAGITNTLQMLQKVTESEKDDVAPELQNLNQRLADLLTNL